VAYIRKLPSGLWRAEVERRGVRESSSFRTKTAAQQWATRREAEILDGAGRWPRKTVADAIHEWERRGCKRPDSLRLGAFVRDYPDLAGAVISDVQGHQIAAWRDARLKLVTPGTVKREATTLRAVWALAAKDLQWCAWPTPWALLRVPSDNPPRDRLIGWREARAILRRLYYVTGVRPQSATQATAWAFLIALRTGMRQGEILRLRPEDVRGNVATVNDHKAKHLTGKPRMVPLSPQGARLLAMLPAGGLPVRPGTLDALFRRAVQACGLVDLHFHDARASFATHMSRRVPVEVLAKITGHRDLRVLFSTYYRETAGAIADRLARRP
jgi:integrase